MRHSRAQLERGGSVGSVPLDSAGGLSASTSALFTPLSIAPGSGSGGVTSPGSGAVTAGGSRRNSLDDMTMTPGISTAFAGMGAGMNRADSDEFMKQSGRLKPVLVQAIDEVVNELETTHEDVAKGAKEHVHSS